MKKLILRLLLLTVAVSFGAFAQPPSADNGKVVYDNWCVHCHGDADDGGLPGTSALAIRYNGAVPAVLEERTDLQADFIRTVVRNGLFSMPRTRKTEVSDAELDDVVAYLTGKD